MENSLSYVICCWLFTTTAHQRIVLTVLKLSKYSRGNEVKTVFNCSSSTFRPQAFFKKTKLKLLSHCCHCLFNFPQMFLILFYDAHIVHFWCVPVASLYAVVDGFAVRCCDVMARTSCAPLRSTI